MKDENLADCYVPIEIDHRTNSIQRFSSDYRRLRDDRDSTVWGHIPARDSSRSPGQAHRRGALRLLFRRRDESSERPETQVHAGSPERDFENLSSRPRSRSSRCPRRRKRDLRPMDA